MLKIPPPPPVWVGYWHACDKCHEKNAECYKCDRCHYNDAECGDCDYTEVMSRIPRSFWEDYVREYPNGRVWGTSATPYSFACPV